MKKNQSISIDESNSNNAQAPITKELLSKLTVRSSDFALKYLETTDLNKPQCNRLISWFVKFKLLPDNSSNWASKLNELLFNYEDLKKKSGIADTTQLEEITKELPAIIPRDLGRSFNLFNDYLELLNLKDDTFDESRLRIHRIFYFLQKNCPDFDYLQGYDRFIYLSVCISISFCHELQLNSNATEAFAYYVSYYFISFVSIAKEVLDPDLNLLIMSDLNDFLKNSSAPTASAYKYQNLKCEMYAMNYLLLLFAEQHEPIETLVLWDLIVLHTNFENKIKGDQKKKEFIYAMTVSHLVQIQIGINTTDTMQRIVKANDFNFQRLVNDTNRFFLRKPVNQITAERRGGIPPGIVICVGAIVILAVGIFLYKVLQE
ncbi:hypothetical protein M9Y10_020216 [Tritrichomonas musculus]|uniref:Rab-GAP TBC domain-containing protein n=1 Tax=Tritrichomonas musculus TaxID=1915356 RepID=A0ABR2HGN6_9EUKA